MKVTTLNPSSPGGDLLEEVLDKFSKELSEEIDFDIMSEVRCKSGWTLVQLTAFSYRNTQALEWAKENVTGKWAHSGSLSSKFIFERPEDATAFLLKWK